MDVVDVQTNNVNAKCRSLGQEKVEYRCIEKYTTWHLVTDSVIDC